MEKRVCVCVIVTLTHNFTNAQTCPSCPTTTLELGSGYGTNEERLSTAAVGNDLNGVTIAICGTFRIDEAWRVSNSSFYLERDAEIIVESGAGGQSSEFATLSVSFEGCDAMWKRIKVESGNSAFMVFSTIKDAYIAGVELEAGATFTSDYTDFDRNHIHVLSQGVTNLSIGSGKFYANEFNWSFPTGGTGNNNNRPWIAIDIRGSILDLGVEYNSQIQTHIEGPFEYGVRANESILDVKKTQFTDIAAQVGTVWQGRGVYLLDHSIATVKTNEFSNNFEGILSEFGSSSITVRDNDFEEYSSAIRGRFTSPAFASAVSNRIGTASLSGNKAIMFDQSGAELEAQSNTIYVNSDHGQDSNEPSGLGIKFSAVVGSSGQSKVMANHITLYKSGLSTTERVGVWALNQSRIITRNNNVKIESENNPFMGLRYDNSISSRIEANQVIADEKSTNMGFSLSYSSHAKFCCNVDSLVNSGVFIRGICDDANFSSHESNDCTVGLLLTIGSVLGRQNMKGNRWNGSYSAYGALNSNSDQSMVLASKFIVPSITQPEGPGTFLPQQWFEENPSADDEPCDLIVGFNCIQDQTPGPQLTVFDTLFAAGHIDTSLRDGDVWYASQNLFTKMKEDYSNLYGEYQITDDWYDDQIGKVVEDYYLKRDTIERLFELTPNQQDSIDVALDSIEYYMLELIRIDSSIYEDTISQWGSYMEDRMALVETIDSFFQIHRGVTNNILSDRHTRAQGLITTNGQLSIPDLPTRYERMYHDIFLKTIASGVDTFTTAQTDSLYVIASACPAEAGRAVFWAAALYQYIESEDFDFEGQCNTSSSVISDVEEWETEILELKAVPSPARDFIELVDVPILQDNSSGTYQLIDLSGRTVWQGLPDATQRIPTARLEAGLYILRLQTSDGTIYQTKIVIQR